jgi:hypothetical protein
MREALHIFKKDTRHLRVPIALLLAWTALFLVASPAPLTNQAITGWTGVLQFLVPNISTYVLPIGWWFLICQVVHAEALPGDRQFWLTRPYNRTSLFMAKGLFVLAYITLPMTFAQTAVLVLRGFPLGPYVPGIIWAEVLILAVVVFPAAALAATTSTLTQFVVVGLAAPILFRAKDVLSPWAALEWVRTSVAVSAMVAITSSVLFVQFARRRTGLARMIALGGTLTLVATLHLLPWRGAFALQSHVGQTWEGGLTAELVRFQPPSGWVPDLSGKLQLSFRIVGPPTGTPIVCDAAEVTIEGPDGPWSSGVMGIGRSDAMSSVPDEDCRLYLPLLGIPLDKRADRPVNLDAILYVTVFGPERSTTLQIDHSPTVIPDTGVCAGTTERKFFRVGSETFDDSVTHVGCQTALRDPSRLILFRAASHVEVLSLGRFSYSPFPADLRLQPVDAGYLNFRPIEAVAVVRREIAGHVRVVVHAQDVHLQDFQLGSVR